MISRAILAVLISVSIFALGLSLRISNIQALQTSTDRDNVATHQYFVPKRCKSYNFSAICTRDLSPGCACFSNGTCSYVSNGNACSYCNQDDVLSFNRRQNCPNLGNSTLTVCINSGVLPCPYNLAHPSVCECTQDGSCNYVKESPCEACNGKDVVSALDGQCELLKI